jgi:hypothetical protein
MCRGRGLRGEKRNDEYRICVDRLGLLVSKGAVGQL